MIVKVDPQSWFAEADKPELRDFSGVRYSSYATQHSSLCGVLLLTGAHYLPYKVIHLRE